MKMVLAALFVFLAVPAFADNPSLQDLAKPAPETRPAPQMPSNGSLAQPSCLPPGVPPLAELRWTGAQAHQLVPEEGYLEGKNDTAYVATSREYRHRMTEKRYLFYWIGTQRLAGIDDGEDESPHVWYDAGLVDEWGQVRADGKPSCEWRLQDRSRDHTGVPAGQI